MDITQTILPEMAVVPGNPDKKSDEISGFRYQAGLSADLKFSRVVDWLDTEIKGSYLPM